MARAAALLALGLAVMAAPAARADAIDGEWCAKDGKSLAVRGPHIRTPAGAETQGQYSRHSFVYEPPAGEPDHGAVVVMRIYSDNDMELARIREGVVSESELWHRCDVNS
jgi:hypothetical protein